jgi:hypothetical protein
VPRSENRIVRGIVRVIVRVYEGFLNLPIPIVLVILLLAAIALLGLWVLALYFLVWLLLSL